MNKDAVLGQLRHLLTFVGGALLARSDFDGFNLQEFVGALITVVGAIWSIHDKLAARRRPPPGPSAPSGPAFGGIAPIVLGALLLGLLLSVAMASTGCAQLRSRQVDYSQTATNGTVSKLVTTDTTAQTLFAGRQVLAKWRSSQTQKTQSTEVGALNQESDAGPLLGAISQGVAAAVVQSLGGAAAARPKAAPVAEEPAPSAAPAGPPTAAPPRAPSAVTGKPDVNAGPAVLRLPAVIDTPVTAR